MSDRDTKPPTEQDLAELMALHEAAKHHDWEPGDDAPYLAAASNALPGLVAALREARAEECCMEDHARVCDQSGCIAANVRRDSGRVECAAGHPTRWCEVSERDAALARADKAEAALQGERERADAAERIVLSAGKVCTTVVGDDWQVVALVDTEALDDLHDAIEAATSTPPEPTFSTDAPFDPREQPISTTRTFEGDCPCGAHHTVEVGENSMGWSVDTGTPPDAGTPDIQPCPEGYKRTPDNCYGCEHWKGECVGHENKLRAEMEEPADGE